MHLRVCVYMGMCLNERGTENESNEGSEINELYISRVQSKKKGTFNWVRVMKCYCNMQHIDFMLLYSVGVGVCFRWKTIPRKTKTELPDQKDRSEWSCCLCESASSLLFSIKLQENRYTTDHWPIQLCHETFPFFFFFFLLCLPEESALPSRRLRTWILHLVRP